MTARLVAARGLGALLSPWMGTWRFRSADSGEGRPALPDEPCVFVAWHEFILPLAALFADRGAATLASHHRDGEIAARWLEGLGGVVVRGSGSRGAMTGARQLIRAARAGRPVVLTPDGPRGPRRTAHAGAIAIAAAGGRPIVPLGFAPSVALRLRSWDRFVVPAPGSSILVAIGPAIPAGSLDPRDAASPASLTRALTDAMDRCEPGVRRRRFAVDGWRARVESRLRETWRDPCPPAGFRAASSVHERLRRARHRLYDAGLIRTARAPIPVVSVGGVTVGGSGKTPLASEIANMLGEGGRRVAILTRGYEDELRLHRELRRNGDVWGDRDRHRLAWWAARAGAAVAVLDDGFEHRHLARDLEILAVDRDAILRTNGLPLPAGPFRTDPDWAARRADAIVFTGREPWNREGADLERRLRTRWGGGRGPAAPAFASVVLEPAEATPANAAAAARAPAAPGLALTGIMKPVLFFEQARERFPSIRTFHALADHTTPSPDAWPALRAAGADAGILMTRKDAVRFARLVPRELPCWYLSERLVWIDGRDRIGARLRDLMEGG